MPEWKDYMFRKVRDMAVLFVGLAADGFVIYNSFETEELDIAGFIPGVLIAAALIRAIKYRWNTF